MKGTRDRIAILKLRSFYCQLLVYWPVQYEYEY